MTNYVIADNYSLKVDSNWIQLFKIKNSLGIFFIFYLNENDKDP